MLGEKHFLPAMLFIFNIDFIDIDHCAESIVIVWLTGDEKWMIAEVQRA